MSHHRHTYTATVRGERRTKVKKDGRTVETIETIEAEVEIDLNLFDIAYSLGTAAIQNAGRKASEMRGAAKAKIVSEKILSSRESAW